MAMASIVCTCKECGKEFTHKHPCRNSTDRAAYEAWAEKNVTICPDCYRAAQHKAENEKAAEDAKAMGLPALEGTEKQVQYAEVCRARYIDKVIMLRSVLEGFQIARNAGKTLDDFKVKIDEVEKAGHNVSVHRIAVEVLTRTDAKWYIEHQ